MGKRSCTTSAASPSPSKKQKLIRWRSPSRTPLPPWWKETYLLIREMCAKLVAAVDTMGCDRPQDRDIDPKSRRLTIPISLMLRGQTKDERPVRRLQGWRRGWAGLSRWRECWEREMSWCRRQYARLGSGGGNQYLRQSMEKLRDEFEGDVPKTVDELCSLPGVGPKMAFLCLQNAWDINVGIGVDTHVHRITNRLGWHKPPTTTPEQTRLNLQSWLPSEYHAEINHMLVGFGQALCYPFRPDVICARWRRGSCAPAGARWGRSKAGGREGKVEVEEIEEIEEL
ncbi:DNA glycosylase [Calocera viscosa TUFC12733]|uniref:DNA glycosylase n=1 Tax=Calocera viscosa (strain TUFC12733) TaxID=1330018 RepID=A0A167GBY6_CALVF|nr:DNA glycosylase [Calocera viscosa TUFC12733]